MLSISLSGSSNIEFLSAHASNMIITLTKPARLMVYYISTPFLSLRKAVFHTNYTEGFVLNCIQVRKELNMFFYVALLLMDIANTAILTAKIFV